MKTVQANLGRITHKSFGKEKPFGVIYEGLKGETPISTQSFFYHLRNVEIHTVSDNVVIYGELYKSKLSAEHQVLEKDTLTYHLETNDELFSISRFVIFTDLSIVFTSSSKIEDDVFIEMMKKLYHINAQQLFSKIEIHYRREDFDIFERIYSYSRLIEVELVNIRKSNPIPKPTFQKIEAFLEREKTDVLNAKFKSEKSEGLARDLESHIMSGISIADSAYGESIILGQKPNGEIEKIKSKDKAIRKRIPYIDITEKTEFIAEIIQLFGEYISSEDELIDD
ncbi:hypothetical protein [uncultured Methanolobus sp.]|uniref:hypothetical protein n=1 Tax=uncultured Methanolobus sp. TaxID=218300 RepID=UPI002AAB77B4|nr:hypothetical protein [uncultured Methanolobus sp.]